MSEHNVPSMVAVSVRDMVAGVHKKVELSMESPCEEDMAVDHVRKKIWRRANARDARRGVACRILIADMFA